MKKNKTQEECGIDRFLAALEKQEAAFQAKHPEWTSEKSRSLTDEEVKNLKNSYRLGLKQLKSIGWIS